MIKKIAISTIFSLLITISCLGQQHDWDEAYTHNCKKYHNIKIGDTLCSKCYCDLKKMPFDSVICSTLDSLAVFLQRDSNAAVLIIGTEGTSQEIYNKNRNTSLSEEWQNKTFKYANFAKQYLQYLKHLNNRILCYGEGFKPYTPWPKEWYKQMCYSFLQIVVTTKDSIHPLQLSKNQALELKNIFFETNQWKIHKGVGNKLDLLVNYLFDYPDINIEISGHTDNVGNEVDNLILSEKRANAIKDYVVERGIDNKRILVKGYGSKKPRSANDSENGRMNNRRVEVKIIK
jgi:outer membrane protein OmpA-like peptidoglycan-associated protein